MTDATLHSELSTGGVLAACGTHPEGVHSHHDLDDTWPQYRLVGEVDGKGKYEELLRTGQDPIDVIMAEKRREESIRQLGYWIVRWDWDQAWRPAELSALLLGAMNTSR